MLGCCQFSSIGSFIKTWGFSSLSTPQTLTLFCLPVVCSGFQFNLPNETKPQVKLSDCASTLAWISNHTEEDKNLVKGLICSKFVAVCDIQNHARRVTIRVIEDVLGRLGL